MYQKEITVKAAEGLHARPASLFVQKAKGFPCDIKLKKDNKEANAKSIMSVLGLSVLSGETIIISADGADEQKAVEALESLIESNFK